MMKIMGVMFLLLATGYAQIIAPATTSLTVATAATVAYPVNPAIDPSTLKASDAPPVDFQAMMKSPEFMAAVDKLAALNGAKATSLGLLVVSDPNSLTTN